jgi:hypothetical protein
VRNTGLLIALIPPKRKEETFGYQKARPPILGAGSPPPGIAKRVAPVLAKSLAHTQTWRAVILTIAAGNHFANAIRTIVAIR